MTLAAASAVALVWLGCCGWTAYLAALRLGSTGTPTSLRWTAAAGWALWLQSVLFTALSAVGGFTLAAALPLWLVVAVAAHLAWDGGAALTQLRLDALRGRELAAEFLRSPVRAILLLAVAALLIQTAGVGAVSPPLGWDALVYHFYNPARWIQDAAHTVQLAPDGSGHYEFYPHAGSIPWAWAMLPVRGDALLAPAGILVWGACLAGAYGLARGLGGARIPSACAALAVGLTPCVFGANLAGNDDNTMLAIFLIASAVLVQAHRAPGPAIAACAGACLGVLASIKVSAVLPAGLGLMLLGASVLRRGSGTTRSRALSLCGAAAAAAAAGSPGYVRALLHTGNPFYPMEVRVLGRVIWAGNEGFREVLDGTLFHADPAAGGLGSVLRALAQPILPPFLGGAGGGFGPAAVLLLPLAALGLRELFRRRPSLRVPALVVVAMAVLPFVAIFSPRLITLRTEWLGILGRLVSPLLGVIAVLAAQGTRGGERDRLVEGVWWIVLAVDLAIAVPTGVGEPISEASRSLWGAAALALVAALLVALAGRWLKFPRAGLLGAAALFVLVLAPRVEAIRARSRYPIWADAMRGGSCVLFRLAPDFAAAWPLWEFLDDGAPHRIALASGWNGVMHNGYRYPLLGSRLQNTVHYVPVSRDGELVDYRLDRELRARADYDRWIRRLEEGGIDYVVIYAPAPIEAGWMRAHPERFELAARGDGTVENAVFRVLNVARIGPSR